MWFFLTQCHNTKLQALTFRMTLALNPIKLWKNNVIIGLNPWSDRNAGTNAELNKGRCGVSVLYSEDAC